jgi:RNA recognition motif-containing protein
MSTDAGPLQWSEVTRTGGKGYRHEYSDSEKQEDRTKELAARESFSDETSVFVLNVHHDTSENEIVEAFSKFGKVRKVWLSVVKPHGIVTFESVEGKKKALSASEPIVFHNEPVKMKGKIVGIVFFNRISLFLSNLCGF